jgi:hypothetical protein
LDPILDRDPWYFDQDVNNLIFERFINNKNKMVVMKWDVKEEKLTFTILNEKEGNWDKGVWFSNFSWKPYKPATDWKGHEYMNVKVLVEGEWIEWLTPDKKGWYWSFVLDCWVNSKTNTHVDHLSYRSPPYPVNKKVIPFVGGVGAFTKEEQQAIIARHALQRQLALEDAEWQVPDDDDPIPKNGVPGITHLSKEEKGLLLKASYKLLKEVMWMSKTDIRKYGQAERIDWLRDWVKEEKLIHEDMSYGEVDLWMVQMLKDGKLKIEFKLPKEETKPIIIPTENLLDQYEGFGM